MPASVRRAKTYRLLEWLAGQIGVAPPALPLCFYSKEKIAPDIPKGSDDTWDNTTDHILRSSGTSTPLLSHFFFEKFALVLLLSPARSAYPRLNLRTRADKLNGTTTSLWEWHSGTLLWQWRHKKGTVRSEYDAGGLGEFCNAIRACSTVKANK